MKNRHQHSLFPGELPLLEWSSFNSPGYANPAAGLVYSASKPPCCGVPLGGIGTGCLDIDARGVFGYSTLFNPVTVEPNMMGTRRVPDLQPFLGLAVGGKTWVLTTSDMISGDAVPWCTKPSSQRETSEGKPINQAKTIEISGVNPVDDIRYWGHYPVVDMEYACDAPISVGLRAWSPFIPGNAALSNIPAIVFEVHLRNESVEAQQATLAINFPGPTVAEARRTEFVRQVYEEDFNGIFISAEGEVNYLLGVLDGEKARFGSSLSNTSGNTSDAWAKIADCLPQAGFRNLDGEKRYSDSASSAAVDFEMKPGEERVIRFMLTWYAPLIEGIEKNWEDQDNICDLGLDREDGWIKQRWFGSEWAGRKHYFWHMYAARFTSALDVAREVTASHAGWLERILSWQAEIYNEETLPVWLRDSLVNNLSLIAEDAYWFQPKPPLGEFVYPEGAFAMNESPRECPHTSCIPCDWYGNLPIVFFFPELARSNLKMFKEYQDESGEIPFALGLVGALPDMATPEYHWQVSLNGMCYIDMVDRLWQRTGNDEDLAEFYDSVKECNTFTMNLCKGPGGPISMPEEGGMEWFELGEWVGMAAHLGGLRLAELRMVIRMAKAMGDEDYLAMCKAWYLDGSRAMENDLWTGSYYLNFWDKQTGKKSDDVMGYQLDGEWAALYHGLEGVFQSERVPITLDTIRLTNIALTPDVGAANFARPDGSPLAADTAVAEYGRFAMFPPELVILGMTYIYAGEKDFGLELVRKHWHTMVVRHGHAWDLPNIINGDDGRRRFGTEYYQNMILWALPAALAGEDIRTSCAAGGLIDRVIKAGK